MKLAVVGIAFKMMPEGIRIMTQRRHVSNKSYDPLYDNTWEAMGETMEQGESVIEALIRGFQEECGDPAFLPRKIFGANAKIWTTGKGDAIQLTEPFCLVQSLGPPQPWIGPVFLVRVPRDWEPNIDRADGEAGDWRWWHAGDLLTEIERAPHNFMGWQIPALHKFCSAIMNGAFSP